MSQAIKIQADFVEESNGFVVLKTQDTVFRLPSECVIGIAPSGNPLDKYDHTVTLKDNAEIEACEVLDTSRNIVSNIFHNLPADRVRNDKADYITFCHFCICTPQDCDCDCF